MLMLCAQILYLLFTYELLLHGSPCRIFYSRQTLVPKHHPCSSTVSCLVEPSSPPTATQPPPTQQQPHRRLGHLYTQLATVCSFTFFWPFIHSRCHLSRLFWPPISSSMTPVTCPSYSQPPASLRSSTSIAALPDCPHCHKKNCWPLTVFSSI